MARILDNNQINELNQEDFLKQFEEDLKDREQDLKIEDVEREPEQTFTPKQVNDKRYNSAKFAVNRVNDLVVMICEIVAKTSDVEFAMDEDEIRSYSEMLKDYMDITETTGIDPKYLLAIGFILMFVRKIYKAYKIRRSEKEQDELAEKIKEIEDLQIQLTLQAKEKKIENSENGTTE